MRISPLAWRGLAQRDSGASRGDARRVGFVAHKCWRTQAYLPACSTQVSVLEHIDEFT